MGFIARPANFSGLFEARVTLTGREWCRWLNWKEEAMGRCAIIFARVGDYSAPAAAMAQSVG